MPHVPHDIPPPHTLVLDLEKTLVSSTWDRKHGWRHAKRPGVDQFLKTMAQYYEIVLYSPSFDAVADPVVSGIDKSGCIMHRLYRDATHYSPKTGAHVKDLDRLNRNVNRIIVVDDDPSEVEFHPYNLLRVKPYEDATDRTDNTLERITPFLLEIARDGHNDIPALMRQYQGMDADEIMDEQDRRLLQLKADTDRLSQRGLGRLAASGSSLPAPELPPTMQGATPSPLRPGQQQLTAKDIAGANPVGDKSDSAGIAGWMARRAAEKEEQQMRKMEKWTQVMNDRKKKQQDQQQ